MSEDDLDRCISDDDLFFTVKAATLQAILHRVGCKFVKNPASRIPASYLRDSDTQVIPCNKCHPIVPSRYKRR